MLPRSVNLAFCYLLCWVLPASLAPQAPVVELPAEDVALPAEFEDVFRIGDGGADWEQLTSVTSLGSTQMATCTSLPSLAPWSPEVNCVSWSLIP